MSPGRDADQDVATIVDRWRGRQLRDFSHLAIRPFDGNDCGLKRFRRKLEQFRRGFIKEEGGVSGQFCRVLPPRERWTPGMLGAVQAMSCELERLADELGREAEWCDEIAAELLAQLERCGAIKAEGQPDLPVPRRDPGPRPDRPVPPPSPGGGA